MPICKCVSGVKSWWITFWKFLALTEVTSPTAAIEPLDTGVVTNLNIIDEFPNCDDNPSTCFALVGASPDY